MKIYTIMLVFDRLVFGRMNFGRLNFGRLGLHPITITGGTTSFINSTRHLGSKSRPVTMPPDFFLASRNENIIALCIRNDNLLSKLENYNCTMGLLSHNHSSISWICQLIFLGTPIPSAIYCTQKKLSTKSTFYK